MPVCNDCARRFQERNVDKKRKAMARLLQSYTLSREKMRRALLRRRAELAADGGEVDQARRDSDNRRSSELLISAFSHND